MLVVVIYDAHWVVCILPSSRMDAGTAKSFACMLQLNESVRQKQLQLQVQQQQEQDLKQQLASCQTTEQHAQASVDRNLSSFYVNEISPLLDPKI